MWAPGYTALELDAIQAKFGLRFPPDLIELYLDRRPAQGYDWLKDEAAIQDLLGRPLEGILFDVEQGIWWDHWGQQPASMKERKEVVSQLVSAAPKLIPIYGHRFIPEKPDECGNPVFSVHQSDIIYYGANLDDYFQREFKSNPEPPWPPIKRIPFWSDFAEG
jgi:hypothetical protein